MRSVIRRVSCGNAANRRVANVRDEIKEGEQIEVKVINGRLG